MFDKEKKKYDLSFFFKIKIVPKIIKLVLTEKFDVIVFHGYYFPNIICAIISKLTGKKTIMRSISYNLGKRNFLKKLFRNVYYRLSNLFLDKFWTCHQLNEDFFISFGAKKENCILIDHCQGEYKKLLDNNKSILISKDEFCKKHDLPNDKKFIMFAGRFIERANPKILFEAWADGNFDDKWYLIMAGHGKFKKEIVDSAEKKKVRNLKFLGFQNQTSIINFFEHSEILILPSGWNATNGNIASEGIQFGCALIVSDMVGLYPEFVEQKVGLVFDVLDKNKLINAINRFINDENLLKNYQINAREYGKQKTPEYSANLIEKALLEF